MDRTCVNCSTAFEVEKKRGRPHTKCGSCRKIPKTNPCLEIKPMKVTEEEKPKRKFRDEPTKGNARYSRAAFIEALNTMDFSKGRPTAQEIAEVIRGLNG